MKVSGNIVSLALTIGALMLHVSEARSQLRRVLEDAGDDADADAEADAEATDDGSSYSSGGYNGRGQYWSNNIQSYDDDGMTEFEVDNSRHSLNLFGSLGGGEIFMLVGLIIVVGISVFSYLALKNGFNVIHLLQVYVSPAVFGHKDQKTTSEPPLEEAESSEPTGDFVKIENVETC